MTQQAEILPMETGIEVYKPYRSQLAEMKKNNSLLVFDYESATGNKDARSYIWKLRKTKSAVDDARKKEKAASLEYGRKVDAEAKEITTELEAMIEVHQTRVDEIEQREKIRLERIQGIIKHINDCGFGLIDGKQQPLGLCLYEVKEKIVIDDTFGEFEAEANRAKEAAIDKLEAAIADAAKRGAEQEELARLRKESEERAQRDREEQIRKDAAEKAKRDAEDTARREADALAAKVKADAEAAEKARLDAQREKEAAEARAKKAEEDRIAAEQKAERDRIEAAEKAEREKQEAIAAERERAEEQKRREAEQKAKREADIAHRQSVQKAVVQALLEQLPDDLHSDDPMELPTAIMNIIDAGLIPNVTITY